MEIVLDTNVLCVADESSEPRSLDSMMLLLTIKKHHRISIDFDGNIQDQYVRNIKPRSHVGEWWKFMVSRSEKIMRRTGKVPNKNRRYLLDTLQFDESDLVFVGVARESPEGLLVSGDSDYTAEVKKYISEELGIETIEIEEALVRASA